MFTQSGCTDKGIRNFSLRQIQKRQNCTKSTLESCLVWFKQKAQTFNIITFLIIKFHLIELHLIRE